MKIKNRFNRCFALALGVAAMMFAACGDDSTSVSDKEPSATVVDEVETKDKLPNCNSKREGERYYVEDEDADYLCEGGKWKKLSAADDDDDDSSKDNEKDDDEKSSSSTKKSSSSKKEDSSDEDAAKSSSSVKGDSSDDGKDSGKSSSSAKLSSSSAKSSSSSVQSSSSSAKPTSSAIPELRACGEEGTYDETKFICIEGKLYSLCGKRAYDPSVKFCVESKGVVYDLCGGESYDVDKEFCQEATDEVLGKCGGSQYASAQFCYKGKIYNKCGGESYNPSTNYCKDDVVTESKMLTCNGQYYSTSEQFCSGKTIYDLCGGSSYNVSTEFCLNSVVTAKCGGKTFTQDLFCYKESILLNRCGGETYNPDEEICKDGEPVTLTKGTLFDSRNGIVYKTVTIGTQTWMAENLNYDDSVSTPNLKGGSWCYDNKDENCETYGRLYTWAAAMNLESKYNSSDADDLVQTKHQGICPEGWHIPTNAEWSTLESHVDGLDDVDNNAGHWLKTQYGWSGASGNDGVGFSVLPTGCRYDSDYFSGLGSSASFWSASEYSSGGVYYLLLLSGYSSLGNDYDGKSIGLSVRCLQD